jgi:hypothetical protein
MEKVVTSSFFGDKKERIEYIVYIPTRASKKDVLGCNRPVPSVILLHSFGENTKAEDFLNFNTLSQREYSALQLNLFRKNIDLPNFPAEYM